MKKKSIFPGVSWIGYSFFGCARLVFFVWTAPLRIEIKNWTQDFVASERSSLRNSAPLTFQVFTQPSAIETAANEREWAKKQCWYYIYNRLFPVQQTGYQHNGSLWLTHFAWNSGSKVVAPLQYQHFRSFISFQCDLQYNFQILPRNTTFFQYVVALVYTSLQNIFCCNVP